LSISSPYSASRAISRESWARKEAVRRANSRRRKPARPAATSAINPAATSIEPSWVDGHHDDTPGSASTVGTAVGGAWAVAGAADPARRAVARARVGRLTFTAGGSPEAGRKRV